MTKILNANDITKLTEVQKSELSKYVNYLTARNKAAFSIGSIVFCAALVVIVLLYVRPALNALLDSFEFVPTLLVLAFWMALPTAIAFLAVSLIIAWNNRAWNLPLYILGVNLLRTEFNARHSLDISKLNVMEIVEGIVCED